MIDRKIGGEKKSIPKNFVTGIPYYYQRITKLVGKRIFVLIGLAALGALTEGLSIGLILPAILSADEFAAGAGQLGFTQLIMEKVGLVGVVMIIGGARVVIEVGARFLKTMTIQRMALNVRLRLLSGLEVASYLTGSGLGSGDFGNTMSAEIRTMMTWVGKYIELLNAVIFSIVLGVAVICLSWKLALSSLICGLLLFGLSRLFSGGRQILSGRVVSQNSLGLMLVNQAFQNYKYLKATGSLEWLVKRASSTFEEARRLMVKNAAGVAIFGGINQLTVVVAFGVMIHLTIGEGVEPLMLVIVLGMLYRALQSVVKANDTWMVFCAAVGSYDSIEATLMRLESEKECSSEAMESFSGFEEGVGFEGVSFSYSGRPVLVDLSLWFAKGATIGIVGESGAGKSTITNLLTGLISPESGVIKVDGVDLRSIRLDSYATRIGYVAQEVVMFEGSIKDNISLWDANFDEGRFVRASLNSDVDRFVKELPQGYDTQVGEAGVSLSGGQRQRIAIARELYKMPELLIFDEASSALDSHSEQNIQASIQHLRGRMTIILIAHGLSSLKDCDVIYVLERGKLVESGSWEDLAQKRGGCFSKMLALQS